MESYTLFLNTAVNTNRVFNSGTNRWDVTFYVDWTFLPKDTEMFNIEVNYQSNSTPTAFLSYVLNIDFGENLKYGQNNVNTILCGMIRTVTNGTKNPQGYEMVSLVEPFAIYRPTQSFLRVTTTTISGNPNPANAPDYMLFLTFTPIRKLK
jgi:hypothetical protein